MAGVKPTVTQSLFPFFYLWELDGHALELNCTSYWTITHTDIYTVHSKHWRRVSHIHIVYTTYTYTWWTEIHVQLIKSSSSEKELKGYIRGAKSLFLSLSFFFFFFLSLYSFSFCEKQSPCLLFVWQQPTWTPCPYIGTHTTPAYYR